MEKKPCFECGGVIRGRSDKKFCSDMCRNTHNNRLNSDCNNLVRNVNNILRRNRRIIEGFLTDSSTRTTKTRLKEKGFNFLFFTNSLTTGKEETYYFCYEFGYTLMEKEEIYLVRKNEQQINETEMQLK